MPVLNPGCRVRTAGTTRSLQDAFQKSNMVPASDSVLVVFQPLMVLALGFFNNSSPIPKTMMRTLPFTVAFVLMFPIAFNVVNAVAQESDVEKVLSDLEKAKDKAKQDLQRAEKLAMGQAVGKLQKLAEKAYKAGDRLAETASWKGVLTLDPSHEKARKYFEDLGTLEQTLKDVGAGSVEQTAKKNPMVGKWKFRFHNGRSGEFVVTPKGQIEDYVFESRNVDNIKAKFNGDQGLVENISDNAFERWTMAGDKMLIEQWYPAQLYTPGAEAPSFAIAIKVQ